MPMGFMAQELLKKIVEQLPRQTVIVPFFRGESLMHPNFPEVMQELSKFEDVQLASNGDLLHGTVKKAVLDNASFFSLSLHKYELPNHLSFFYEAAGKLVTQVSILEEYLSEKHKKMFIREWRRHVDKVRIYKRHSTDGYGNCNSPPIDPTLGCHKPFEEIAIYWNGKTALCNHDWNTKLATGNLNFQSINEVYNDEVYREIRQRHLEGERATVPMCTKCDSWKVRHVPHKMFGELHV